MKKVYIILVVVLLVVLGVLGVFIFKKDEKDSLKFQKEYSLEDSNNVFVYRSSEEIINILTNGTGVVYLGFPECPWCNDYVKYLNEVAKQNEIDKIYYLNILNDRKDNTEEYVKIVNLIKDYLQFDEEGNKRIYVPAVIAINKGEIVGFDDETAWDTKGYETPQEYWENEDLDGLKTKLKDMFIKTKGNICTTDCNK